MTSKTIHTWKLVKFFKSIEPISGSLSLLVALLTLTAPKLHDMFYADKCYYTYTITPNPTARDSESFGQYCSTLLSQFPITEKEKREAMPIIEFAATTMTKLTNKGRPDGDNFTIWILNPRQTAIQNFALTINNKSKYYGYAAEPVSNWFDGNNNSPVNKFDNGITYKHGTIPAEKSVKLTFGFENLDGTSIDMIAEKSPGVQIHGDQLTGEQFNKMVSEVNQNNLPSQFRLLKYIGLLFALLVAIAGAMYRSFDNRLRLVEEQTNKTQ